MARKKFRRQKEERPGQIIRAALDAFAERGYDATRVTDVARRAGVSKGLLYLYFSTKAELFKAVIRNFVSPRIAALEQAVENSDLSAEAFLRGPFVEFARRIPSSPARILVRLMIAEGPKHPELTAWYWQQVAGPGLAALGRVVERGVEAGEFRRSALQEFPQMLISPVLVSVAWKSVFDEHHPLDTDRLIESQVNLIVDAIVDREVDS